VTARRAQVSVRSVERWRARFVDRRLAGLEDRPRPGHKPTFGALARMETIALACEPVDAQNGMTRRTLEDIRQQVIERGVADAISRSTVQRILSQADLHPHRIQGWLHSPDPDFRRKVADICALYHRPPAHSVVLSIDEKTGMQAIARRFPDRAPAPGRRRRREFEYKRNGTQTLIAALDVHTGAVLATCQQTRTADDLCAFMEEVAHRYPTGSVHVIWDNLNTHLDGPDKRWTEFNARHAHRFVFHFTPKHASWVNQIELFFGILQRQCLRNGSFATTAELRRTVLAFIEFWNLHKARPFRWTFTGYPLQSGIEIDDAEFAATG
jgi:transposase